VSATAGRIPPRTSDVANASITIAHIARLSLDEDAVRDLMIVNRHAFVMVSPFLGDARFAYHWAWRMATRSDQQRRYPDA
jgi:hypothetical protein